ncbi:MAG: ABC transporter ATP-binding protein [Candidatus Aminicenantes bacterium]|nr:ABC transporter ATP-binding protein [Candidatus Aminicenantes bacterium]
MSLLQFENISRIYHTGALESYALRSVSFEIDKGEFVSIAGPSGSGKTTILNITGCLDKATSGNYFLDGEDISEKSSNSLALIRRDKIGFIFQTFNLIPILTAFENVEFPLILNGGISQGERARKVENILDEVGLLELKGRKPSELSGGQQQRVSIARALVKGPELVLADEPTANLDSASGKDILDLMLELNNKLGVTFVFSTHDRMVMDYARRLIMLKDGEVESDKKRG